jgi:hypothetical protein
MLQVFGTFVTPAINGGLKPVIKTSRPSATMSGHADYQSLMKIPIEVRIGVAILLPVMLLWYDEGLSEPFRIRFKDQSRLRSRVAELWIHGAEAWIVELKARHFSLPISGTLTSADHRTITLETLE